MDPAIFGLLGWMIIVLFSAVIFVNAVEYIGYRMHLGHSFVGAIIAPLFTSIPELTVFLVAVFAVGNLRARRLVLARCLVNLSWLRVSHTVW